MLNVECDPTIENVECLMLNVECDPSIQNSTFNTQNLKISTQNLLIRGECLSACAYLKEQGITVDLVYIDPPFASGADYAKKVYLRRNPLLAEKLKKAEEAMELDELRAFEEKMYGDIWNKEDYLNWMYENIMAVKSVMSANASIYVHLDWHIGHYVKVLMDEVFGEQHFRNEIIWKRTSGHSDAGRYGNSHDTIFYYTNNDEYIWNQIYQEYDPEYVENYYRYSDDDGRNWMSGDLGAEGLQGGGYDYIWKGVQRVWRVPAKTMSRLDDEGRIFYTKNGIPRIKRYLDESLGLPAQDIWADVESIRSWHGEKTDYNTQKPESLLERIIKASSNDGMVVADFFGGSGVTAVVANRLGRRFIHVDVGINSLQTTRDRLIAAKADFAILEVKDGVSLFRNPVQTMDKLEKLIPGYQKFNSTFKIQNSTLPSIFSGAIAESKLGMIPVYLPNLLDHSTRVLDIPLMNRILNEAMPDLSDETKQVIVYYIDIEDELILKRFIIDNNPTETTVELRDLKELLHEVVADDVVEYELSQSVDAWDITFTGFTSDRLSQKIEEYNQKRALNGARKSLLDVAGENGEEENGEEVKPRKKYKPIVISENGLELIELVSLDCSNSNGVWTSDHELKIDKNGHVILNGVKSKTFWDATISSNQKPLRMKIRNIAGDETIITVPCTAWV